MKPQTPSPKPEMRSRLQLGSGFIWAPAALVLFIASTAAALTPAVLVGPDLESQPVTVTGLHGDRLIYFDAQRRLRSESVAGFVQLRGLAPDGARPGSSGRHSAYIELADGQRFVGHLAAPSAPGAGSAGDAVYWRTPALGTVRIPLDRITRVRLVPGDEAGTSTPGPAADTAVLTNGDVIAGFIVGISATAVEILPGAAPEGAAALTLPMGRVAELQLANPPSYADPVDPRERIVTLGSGSRIRVVNLDLADGQVTFDLPLAVQPADPRTLPVERVVRIDFTGSGWRLVDLADRPMSVTAGGDVLGLPMPPRVEAGDILMHAPVRVSFDVPEGAQRLAADAALNLGEKTPPRAARWADFEVIVGAGDGSGHRLRLSADHRAAAINVPLDDGPLTIELEPGINGPVLDRLRLRDAVLLVRTQVQPTSESAGQ